MPASQNRCLGDVWDIGEAPGKDRGKSGGGKKLTGPSLHLLRHQKQVNMPGPRLFVNRVSCAAARWPMLKTVRLSTWCRRVRVRHGVGWAGLSLAAALLIVAGCQSPGEHRAEADDVALRIIEQTQEAALGRSEPFTIEKPADTLRRRLMLTQELPHRSAASLGTQQLDAIDHWPRDDYLQRGIDEDDGTPAVPDESVLTINLDDALRIAARNSRDYQSQKESVFRAALNLDLERNFFRTTFAGGIDGFLQTNRSGGGSPTTGIDSTTDLSLQRRLESGMTLTSAIALDLAKLLSDGSPGSAALAWDGSIQIPLLRGSGRHIVREPLTQAERDTLYAIWEFERFKGTFAVRIASEYLGVLQRLNALENAEANYRSLILATRRMRSLAETDRRSGLELGQAEADELRARDQWINAQQNYARQLDRFKIVLGLPTDAVLDLEREELERLAASARTVLEQMQQQDDLRDPEDDISADAPVHLPPPDRQAAGPYELDETLALQLALNHRLDLFVSEGQVYDAQRRVVVAADRLGAELTLLGRASVGERRSIGSAGQPDALDLRFDRGTYSALLSLDLPLERTAERNVYRTSLISMENAVRSLQNLEDEIKFSIRDNLRTLLQSREGLRIQARAVELAQQQVDRAQLLLERGDAQIRDLLEAQRDLLSAQNALTASLVNYRVAELELQRDMGVLEVDADGLWQEFDPGEMNDEG